jgi:Tfp pilus assembly protein PilO
MNNIRLLYRKGHFILFVLLLIISFGGFYNISVKNNLDAISSSIVRIEAKKQLLELYSEKIKLEGELLSLSAMFPQDSDPRWIMAIVNNIAKKERVEIITVRPMPVVVGDFHDELRISVAMEGSYHQIGRMVAAIDNTDKYIQIDHLKALAVSGGKSASQSGSEEVVVGWQATVISVVPKI